MRTANKGEWSEFYVFLKLLGDCGIYAADGDLNKIDDLHFPLVKILRKEKDEIKEYLNASPLIRIIDASTQKCLLEMPREEFQKQATFMLDTINGSNKTFCIPQIEKFMDIIHCTKVKADCNDKSDMNIVLHDKQTFKDTLFGFSIKSKLGGSSTLLNAGKTTNFIYEITGALPESEITKINEISSKSKIKDRINAILDSGCKLNFVEMESNNFYSNLQVIDTALPQIVAEVLKIYYQGKAVTIEDLTNEIKLLNPCNYDLSHNHSFYEYKIKNLLSDSALGMMPATPWTGKVDATGGYIVVRDDGEILCYHLYNRNEFQDYLFKNTKLETPSSTRYEFGKIYKSSGKNYIKLNLQVRFI